VNRVNSVNPPDNNEKGAETPSPNLTLASKKGEVGLETRPDYADVLGMPADDAIQIWQSVGAPVVHLGPGENCLDLAKLLSRPGVLERHLETVRTWLEKRTNKLGEPGQC
jgi:hypothetical protein